MLKEDKKESVSALASGFKIQAGRWGGVGWAEQQGSGDPFELERQDTKEAPGDPLWL